MRTSGFSPFTGFKGATLLSLTFSLLLACGQPDDPAASSSSPPETCEGNETPAPLQLPPGACRSPVITQLIPHRGKPGQEVRI